MSSTDGYRSVLGWSAKPLGEFCEIQIGRTPSRNISRFWAESVEGLPWATIADLRSGYVEDTTERITAEAVRQTNAKAVATGTLLMSFKLTLGRVAVAGIDLYTNEAIAALAPYDDRVCRDWLYYILPQVTANAATDQAIKGQTLNQDKLRSLVIPIPPLDQQRRIAEILSTVDAAIQRTEALIAKLKLMRAGLLHDLLTRGIDENGELRDPIRQPELFRGSPIGKLPVGWCAPTFEEAAVGDASICYGIVQPGVYDAGGVPVVAIYNLNTDYDTHIFL